MILPFKVCSEQQVKGAGIDSCNGAFEPRCKAYDTLSRLASKGSRRNPSTANQASSGMPVLF